jgi:hypothetical protein
MVFASVARTIFLVRRSSKDHVIRFEQIPAAKKLRFLQSAHVRIVAPKPWSASDVYKPS